MAFFGRCLRMVGVIRSNPGALCLGSLEIMRDTSLGWKEGGGRDKGRGMTSCSSIKAEWLASRIFSWG